MLSNVLQVFQPDELEELVHLGGRESDAMQVPPARIQGHAAQLEVRVANARRAVRERGEQVAAHVRKEEALFEGGRLLRRVSGIGS